MKPNVTFTAFNHPPDLGKLPNQLGKIANNVNGIAREAEKPSIPMNCPNSSPLLAALTINVPINGPVHENDANASAIAMKKIPIKPPLSAFSSAFVAQELGNVISKAPKNEAAKITRIAKKIRLK